MQITIPKYVQNFLFQPLNAFEALSKDYASHYLPT